MSTLRYGSVGSEVTTLQGNYNKLGVSKATLGRDLSTDGDFGPNTLAVTHAFQKANGLVDDGLVGPMTQAKIAALLSTGTGTGTGTGTTTVPDGWVYGIDAYNGDSFSDWNKFQASKFAFVMHKATEGNSFTDRSFASRRTQVESIDKYFGAYMYIHPNMSAKSQADHFIQVVGKIHDDEMPPAIDWEEDNGMSNSQMNDCVHGIVEALRSGLGVNPMIYGSWGQLSGYGIRSEFAGNPLWVADLRAGSAPRLPTPWSKYALWQYSFTAQVPGIGNDCDVNKFQGDINTLKQFIKDSKL